MIGSGGVPAPRGGAMGTPGVAGGDGGSSIVRRRTGQVIGPNLVVFPGGAGGRGGIGSTHQPAVTPGGAAAPGGTDGGAGGRESAAGNPGGHSLVLQGMGCSPSIGGSTSAGNGGGGGGGGSALCDGGDGGKGGTFAGAPGADAAPGLPGRFGGGGGGAGARGEGGESGLPGGAGGGGLVIVFWGDQAADFPIATDRPSSVSMPEAALRRIRAAIGATCQCRRR